MVNRLRWSILLLALTGLVACGDARLSSEQGASSFEDAGVDRGPIDDDAGGVATPDAPVQDDSGFIPDPEEPRCVLIPSVGGDVFVGVDSAVQLGVYQYSIATGEPMVDEPVEFEIVTDGSDARLSSGRVTTDEDGLAAVRLNAGATPGALIVRALSPCATAVDLEVDVLELPTGNVRVLFNYPFRDVYDVSPVRVDLFLADELDCRELDRGELPAGALATQEASNVAGSVTFNGLMVDTAYTIVVIGYGEHGERAASGCAGNVLPRDGRTIEETVDMLLLPLDPVGDYDALSHWDFRDAISESGEVGAMIVQVLDIFEDPGRGIVSFILDLVEDYVGGIVGGAISLFLDITGLDDVIGDAINSLIDSSPLLSDIVTIGRDLRQVIAELEVVSKISIGKLGSDYEVFGVDEWIGLALYWRLGCSESDPPDCGRVEIILDTVDLGLLRGEWNGRVLGYDRLDIGRHPVDFEYGRLILYVLEYLVLPAITGDPGPVTLEDLMAAIIDCDGIGDFVAGGDGDCLCALGACICDDDVEDICTGFISLTFGGLFTSFVNALSFDAVIEMRGEVTLQNNNDDLLVDALIDGEYVGNILIGESPTPFTADMCGVREGLDLVGTCLGD